MNIKSFALIFFIVSLWHIHCMEADPLSGTQLEIGPTGYDQVQGTYNSGAIGAHNDVGATNSLLVGTWNQNWGFGSSFSVGDHNTMGSLDTVVVGEHNSTYSWHSLVVGAYNSDDFGFGDDWFSPMESSLTVGYFNYSFASSCSIVVGQNNSMTYPWCSGTIGRGLINNWNHCLVIGQYNISQNNTSLSFVIGNGTGIVSDSHQRGNSLEVYNDGAVIIPKRQGDIVMGEFGTPNSGD